MGDDTSDRTGVPDGKGLEAERKCLFDMLEYLEGQVKRAQTIGVDLSEVENLLAGARMMIESGELAEAAELIGQCMQVAGKRFSEHEILTQSIKKAEAEIQAARDSGRDISEPCKLLKLARHHMESGDYRLGIEAAKRALDELANRKPAQIVWGSGLQAEGD